MRRILTQFAFASKISYLCNSGAGLFMRKSRFFCDSQICSGCFPPYFFLKIPVLQLKFQVFVLKIRYGLFKFQVLDFPKGHSEKLRKVKNVKYEIFF